MFTGRDDYGNPRYFSFAKQYKDAPELIFAFKDPENPDYLPETAPTKMMMQSLKKIGGKAAPLPTALSLGTIGYTIGGFRPYRITEAKRKGTGVWQAQLISAAAQFTPFVGVTIADPRKEFGFKKFISGFNELAKGQPKEAAVKLIKGGGLMTLNMTVQQQAPPSVNQLKSALEVAVGDLARAKNEMEESAKDGVIPLKSKQKDVYGFSISYLPIEKITSLSIKPHASYSSISELEINFSKKNSKFIFEEHNKSKEVFVDYVENFIK